MKLPQKITISAQQLLGKLQKYWLDNKENKKLDPDLLKKVTTEIQQSASKKD